MPLPKSTRLYVVVATLLTAGCATMRVEPDAFEPLDERAAARALGEIAAATSGWHLVKFVMDCRIDMPATATHEAVTETFTATCVWEPGARLRVRVRRYRVSVADILFDGQRWYVTDEINQRVYRTRAVGHVRVARIPRVFLRQLQFLPHGWINPLEPYQVAASPHAYRLETATDLFTRRMIVPRGSPLPSEFLITTPEGSAMYAAVSPPDTHLAPHAAMFQPLTSGYELYDLDTGERVAP